MGMEAWVTSAVEDKAVYKAIVLAGSLRRVCTTKKLAVFTSLTVSQELREKLKEVFDLVMLVEQEIPNGLQLEDYAKVQAFSLLVFNKCMYLSPNTLVLKNCDEIFDKYDTFAAYQKGKEFDCSVYLFTPSLKYGKALRKVAHSSNDTTCGEKLQGFSRLFNLWVKNNIRNYEKLDEQYNFGICFKDPTRNKLAGNVTIVNFNAAHPLDFLQDLINDEFGKLGMIAKFAVDLCRNIYMEDIHKRPNIFVDSYLHPEVYKKEPIAIVGISFRLPGGSNVHDFWDLLINGKEAIRPLPENRWTREYSYYPCTNRDVKGGFLDIPLDEFDAKFFGISPKEAEFLDPQQRLLHEVAWEALEDAMIDPHKIRGSNTGIFCGSWLHDYKDIALKSADIEFFRIYMGNSIASEAARLSHFFETTGPSIATESGCSSGIVAVHMACKSLQKQESNMALACGVNLLLHPFTYETLPFVLSKNGRCKTFDSSADGFARAEACTVLILKRFSDAVKDGDNIWGLIRGSAVTQEGVSKSLGTPTVHCESLAMKMALQDSNVRPQDVDYIETHGTGTAVGDPLEVAAIAKAYSTADRFEPIVLGSVKTNVGHTESASGITGIIKVLLSLKNEQIPPHLNLETLNPAINLEAIPAEIPLTLKPWPKQENRTRIAGVSSFGISGTDGHAIIQEAPSYINPQIHYGIDRPKHIMKISAKSPESMEELLAKYEQICNEKADDEEFANLAYSANTGRATFNHRAVIIANNFKEAAKILKDKSFDQADIQGNGSKLCFLFTGQGSQYPNMAYNLYETSPIFRDHFDKCDQILGKQYGIDMRNVLWGKSNDAAELSRTLYSQTSIFVVEYCLLKLWESWGVKPDYVMGHSLGEFAAACAAGALTFEDALMLVAERSRLIDNLPRGKMLVIRADKVTVDGHITKFRETNPKFWVDYAATNASDQTVVAADSSNIEAFETYLKKKSLKTIILASTHAFHSRHMDPMLEAYEDAASNIKKLAIEGDVPRFISGMEGRIVDSEFINAKYWVKHTREPVRFIDACKTAQSEGCKLFLEVGPHPVLSALALMNIESPSVTCLPSLRRGKDEWDTLLESLAKLYLSDWKGEIDWKGFDQYYKRSRVTLPFYPFNRKSTWIKIDYDHPKVHPLLGKIVPTASTETIYENRMTLTNTSFAADHVIGNTILFPGAGFLEICLAGAHLSVQGCPEKLVKPRRPVILKSLKIMTPLSLLDSETRRLQTVIVLDEMGYSVNVHRHISSLDKGGPGEWIHHASAKFLPVAPPETNESIAFDINTIQTTWEKTDNCDFYEQLPEVGLRFGPSFQSLKIGWKSKEGILVSVKIPEDTNEYLIHPILGDAMLQTTMLWTSREKLRKKLHVPVHIGEFVWLQESTSTKRYTFCSTNSEGQTNCILLDDEGNHLAYMRDVDFIETNVKLVEGMIDQQRAALPQLWEEVWKPSPGPLQGQLKLSSDLSQIDRKYQDDEVKLLAEMNDVPERERQFYLNICNYTRLFTLQALYELGWKHERGVPFTLTQILAVLPTKAEEFKQFILFFLRNMALSGFCSLKLDAQEEDQFYFELEPPTKEEIATKLQIIKSTDEISRDEYKIIVQVGKNLTNVFSGKTNPLTLLFPEDKTKVDVTMFYDSMRKWSFGIVDAVCNRTIKPVVDTKLKEYKDSSLCKPILRILELGAGTGSFTKILLENIDKHGYNYEYYYTDISGAFFNNAEKQFQQYRNNMIFKKFDMEKDALEQGYCPAYFDMVLAGEVLHISKDIKKTLKNIRTIVKPRGMLLVHETIASDPRITFIFGLLDGYWQFKDYEFRTTCTLTSDQWILALQESKFDDVSITPTYMNVHGFIAAIATNKEELSMFKTSKPEKSWVIFDDGKGELCNYLSRQLEDVNRIVRVIQKPSQFIEKDLRQKFKTEIQLTTDSEVCGNDKCRLEGVIFLWTLQGAVENESQDQAEGSLSFLSLLQTLSELELYPKVFAITQGATTADNSDVINPVPATVSGLIRSTCNENTMVRATHVDLSPNDSPLKQSYEIFYNLWMEVPAAIAFRGGLRYTPKLISAKVKNNEPLLLPKGCDRFQLILPKSRMISDLEFGFLDNYSLDENEVEVQVKATALNFLDVFVVLKPIPEFEKFNTLGLDVSGVVTKVGSKVTSRKVGDRVIAMNTKENSCLPSHIKIEEQFLIPIPETMTFADGSTMPAVLSTAVHCLINVAKMKRGETVLIHTASGGVGLCAIQLAKHIGVEIIASCGSYRKRNYLQNLGIKHVFNSRTTEFGKQILEVTNGKGVDIVLNSLTGEGFKEASLNALGKNGRFIEMSKLSIWKPEEVKAMRPDVFYKVVDLLSLSKSENEELSQQLKEFLHADFIQPIPYERFDTVNIRGALSYLQQAKHIGKIVCIMPDIKRENSKMKTNTPLFNEESTYLVTGGCGGIGFEVVKWMLTNGAKHVAIAGRSPPKPEIASQIESWNKLGKHVQAFPVDVGNFNQCQKLFNDLECNKNLGFPPLRGVMHAAGVLHDATLENQNWSTFLHTYNPKVRGSWNLHILTRDRLLEHFVLFSSIAATFGSPGQTNHSASNSFEDALASYRKSNGLVACSINWGNFGEVGVATEIDFPGIKPITTSQGLSALEAFLKTQTSQMTVLNIESLNLFCKLFPSIKNYIYDKRLFGEVKPVVVVTSDEFWNQVDSAEGREAKLAIFKHYIKIALRITLKMEQDEHIEDTVDLQSLGIDSLMMLELKNRMQNILGNRLVLTATQLKDCNTTEAFAARLIDILEGDGADSQVQLPTPEELKLLIREDATLPDHICVNADLRKQKKLSKISTIFLTGATGTLGAYLLKYLSHNPNIKKIYCLIRKSWKISALEKLTSRLKAIDLLNQINMDKIECLVGDITSAKFGLLEETYDELSSTVDAIFHSAVYADHTAKYWKAPESVKSNVRTVNVVATNRILEFAIQCNLKYLYYPSTLLTLVGLDDQGNYSEDWQGVDAFNDLGFNPGYPISKHISECLIKQAIERGIPCKIFRLPYIAGDKDTGRCDYLTNHIALRWITFMKLECMHDLPSPLPVMNVNHCSEVSLEIFFNENAPSDVYNIVQSRTEVEQTLIEVAEKFGVSIEPVQYSIFMEKLKAEDESSPIAHFKKLYEEEEDTFVRTFESPSAKIMKQYMEDSDCAFKDIKMLRYAPSFKVGFSESTSTVLYRDLQYLKQQGVFDKFGIRYTK